MRIDLHCHTRFSGEPSEWILQKLGCPESFTQPKRLYEILRAKGMTHVTVTDHNSIDGALEIASLENTFLSEEVTTYFPEDRCKLHVLVYNLREKHHREIQKIRANVYDLTDYLNRKKLFHALAHPLFSINGKLTFDHFEKLLLLFENFELNGSRNETLNEALIQIRDVLTEEDLLMMAERHKITPPFGFTPDKQFVGGSDDHSSLCLGMRYTEVENALSPEDFFTGIRRGEGLVAGKPATPRAFARNLYGIAYQFYKNKMLKKNSRSGGDVIFSVLDRILTTDTLIEQKGPGITAKVKYFFEKQARLWKKNPRESVSFFDQFRQEVMTLADDDPEVKKALKADPSKPEELDDLWFDLVQKITGRLLSRLNTQQLRGLFQADFSQLFQTLGSTGMVYTAMGPYFLAYSLFRKDIAFSREIVRRYAQRKKAQHAAAEEPVKVAHFTDTFHEVNGVALTLKRQVQSALKTGKDYTLVTCDSGNHSELEGVKHFRPLGSFRFEEYRDQKFYYPPFFDILDYCYREEFTHIHSSTPGPIGLAALGVAKSLSLPLIGTYHTAFPQYVKYFTDDNAMEGMMWQAMTLYYSQMDCVLAPSQSTRSDLIERGLSEAKVKVYPRGVDTILFSPSKRSEFYKERFGIQGGLKIIYVGRISKEKNLPHLTRVFKSLHQEIKDLHFVVVGTGPYLEEMKRDLSGVSAIFTGDLRGEALAEAFASADLFVFPSTTDTFGNVVLEAQASGLPVIVTDSGGPQENMVPGETGWVVRGNSDQSLREAIRTLISKPEKLLRMGKAARRYMESRSFDNAFEEAWKLYKTAGSKNSAGDFVDDHDPGEHAVVEKLAFYYAGKEKGSHTCRE